MKKITSPIISFTIAAILIMLIFSGCEKVIVIPLKQSDPNIVVEGVIIDRVQPFSIRITTTQDFFSKEKAPVVTDATVYIIENTGTTDTLFYTSDGVYKTHNNRIAIVGRTYNLLILRNGKTYTAQTEMQPKFKMDSLNYYYAEANAFIPAGFKIIMSGQEPPEPGNYLRIIALRNDSVVVDPFKYIVYDDALVNGSYIVSELPYNFHYNDSVQIVTLGITKEYNNYLVALSTQQSNSGSPFDSPPANPPSNLSKGAIGYFTAASVDTLALRIQ